MATSAADVPVTAAVAEQVLSAAAAASDSASEPVAVAVAERALSPSADVVAALAPEPNQPVTGESPSPHLTSPLPSDADATPLAHIFTATAAQSVASVASELPRQTASDDAASGAVAQLTATPLSTNLATELSPELTAIELSPGLVSDPPVTRAAELGLAPSSDRASGISSDVSALAPALSAALPLEPMPPTVAEFRGDVVNDMPARLPSELSSGAAVAVNPAADALVASIETPLNPEAVLAGAPNGDPTTPTALAGGAVLGSVQALGAERSVGAPAGAERNVGLGTVAWGTVAAAAARATWLPLVPAAASVNGDVAASAGRGSVANLATRRAQASGVRVNALAGAADAPHASPQGLALNATDDLDGNAGQDRQARTAVLVLTVRDGAAEGEGEGEGEDLGARTGALVHTNGAAAATATTATATATEIGSATATAAAAFAAEHAGVRPLLMDAGRGLRPAHGETGPRTADAPESSPTQSETTSAASAVGGSGSAGQAGSAASWTMEMVLRAAWRALRSVALLQPTAITLPELSPPG